MAQLMALDPWLPELTALLERHHEAAYAAALALAPEARHAAGYRVPSYGDALSPATGRARFQDRFASFAELRAAIDARDPGAIIVALELLARVAPADAAPIAVAISELEVVHLCQELARAVAHVLAASGDPDAFAQLLAKLDCYGFELELAGCRWPGGCEAAHARLLALVPAWVDVELPGYASGQPRPEPILLDPSVRLRAQMLAHYLAGHQHPPTRPWLRRAAFHHPDGHFRQACALALAAWPDELEGIAAAIDLDDPTLLRLGIQTALRIDPGGVIERLGGLEAAKTDRRTLLALHEVATDARDRRFGRGGHGWLDAEPRWLALALAWSRDREGKGAAQYLFSEAPAEQVAAAKAAAKAKPKPKPKRLTKAQLAALDRRLTAIAAELAQLVERLRAGGYRFVAERPLAALDAAELAALDQLRAELGALPAELELAWARIGAVDLRGSDPSWARHGHVDHAPPGSSGDPWLTEGLVWLPPSVSLEALEDRPEDSDLAVELPLTLDAAAAAGLSGAPRTIEAPSVGPARLAPGDHAIVDWFERALAWGGFPGFATIPERPEAWLARFRGAPRA